MDNADLFIAEIVKLTQRGLTDCQIGRLLNKHYKTIAYHRSKHGVASGRSHRAALTEQRRAQTVHKRTYKMTDVIYKERSLKSRIKHGLNAYAPITCRGSDCPYRETCGIPNSDLVAGEPCVAEAAVIATLFERYCRELQIEEGDIGGLTRVGHLIDVEIKLIRCDRLMAISPELVHAIWEDEQPKRKLNLIAHYDLLLMRERRKVLSSLL